jgi:Mn2+/Fe2+ NRAMP family transporter
MKRAVSVIGPGLLVAATGIGAGDLATASFAGSHLGTAVLWAVLAGAFLKFVANEGLARWQLATGSTLLEGVVRHFGRLTGWIFLAYLVFWTFFVASSLMSACGVTLHALIPVFSNARDGKIVFGILSSLTGVVLVLKGGFSLFSSIMQVCIGLMFVTVVATAAIVWPGTEEVLHGLFVPSIPNLEGDGLSWTVALMGGIGGTVTVLCYGYWIREAGRTGKDDLRTCRLDLVVAYGVTALFGIAMVIIGSTIEIDGRGATLLVTLSERLVESLGPAGRLIFLVGAVGAVFSSLLGVWQAVPYLFADLWGLLHQPDQETVGGETRVDTRSPAYLGYLAVMALFPMAGLFRGFGEIQKFYALVGAWFFPVLALALLLLNGRSSWVGKSFRNQKLTVTALIGVLLFFSWIAWRAI